MSEIANKYTLKKNNFSIESLFKSLSSPVISEKSTIARSQNKYLFIVQKNATKLEIKFCVEALFDVNVESVSVLNRLGKRKKTPKGFSVRSSTGRAFVKLRQGQKIAFFEGAN